MMLEGVMFIVAVLLIVAGANWLMGYRKGNITLELEDRFTDHGKYVRAVKQELREQGREVSYQGDGEFLIDGNRYLMVARNVSIHGVPLQRTILKRLKK